MQGSGASRAEQDAIIEKLFIWHKLEMEVVHQQQAQIKYLTARVIGSNQGEQVRLGLLGGSTHTDCADGCADGCADDGSSIAGHTAASDPPQRAQYRALVPEYTDPGNSL